MDNGFVLMILGGVFVSLIGLAIPIGILVVIVAAVSKNF